MPTRKIGTIEATKNVPMTFYAAWEPDKKLRSTFYRGECIDVVAAKLVENMDRHSKTVTEFVSHNGMVLELVEDQWKWAFSQNH